MGVVIPFPQRRDRAAQPAHLIAQDDASEFIEHFFKEMEPHLQLDRLMRQIDNTNNGVRAGIRTTLLGPVLDIRLDGAHVAECVWIKSSYYMYFKAEPKRAHAFRTFDELISVLDE